MKSSRFLLVTTAVGLAIGIMTSQMGCSDPPAPTPRAAIFSQVGNGKHSQQECMLGAGQLDWVLVGTIGPDRPPGAPVTPIESGGSNTSVGEFTAHGVGVDCTVVPSGDGFSVNAVATLQGIGSMTVSGQFAKGPADGSLPPPQMMVTGIFQRGDFGQFKQTDCVLSYTRAEQGIAAGRLWGELSCPNAAYAQQNRICNGAAEIRFENCAQ